MEWTCGTLVYGELPVLNKACKMGYLAEFIEKGMLLNLPFCDYDVGMWVIWCLLR